MSTLPDGVEAVIGLAAVLTALGVIYRYIWPAIKVSYRAVRTLEKAAEDYRMSGGFAGLYKELHPNGGGSLRDAVDAGRQEARTAAEEARTAAAEARLAVQEATRVAEAVESNADGIEHLRDQVNDVSQRVTALDQRAADLDGKIDAQGARIDSHRQRNEDTAEELRRYLSQERTDLMDAKQGLEASVSELLMVEGHEQRTKRDRDAGEQ